MANSTIPTTILAAAAVGLLLAGIGVPNTEHVSQAPRSSILALESQSAAELSAAKLELVPVEDTQRPSLAAEIQHDRIGPLRLQYQKLSLE